MNEPHWLPLDLIIAVNQLEVAESGEPHRVRDLGLLESALARPRQHWHYGEGDLVKLAIALLLGIAQNHPFEQGNKRTAFIAAKSFLEGNGCVLRLDDSRDVADMVVRAITREMSEAAFEAWLREHVDGLLSSEDGH